MAYAANSKQHAYFLLKIILNVLKHLDGFHMPCSGDTEMNKIQYSGPHTQQSMDDRGEGLEPILAGFPEVCGYKYG